MNNKAQEFIGFLVLFAVVAAIGTFFVYSIIYAAPQDYVGKKQLELLMGSKELQKAHIFAVQSAKIAVPDALNHLTKSAGCGDYLGFSVWTNRTSKCNMSDPVLKGRYQQMFNTEMDKNLVKYNSLLIPSGNYNVSLKSGKLMNVTGSAIIPLQISFGAAGLPACTGGDSSKTPSTVLKQCFSYNSIFTSYLQKNGLGNLDPLLVESLAYRESECNPLANAGGIMQVDSPCLLNTQSSTRYDSSQFSTWACPTIEKQIDEGTKELYDKYINFKDLPPGDAITLTFFAYNRGTEIAKKAVEYQKQGLSLQDAMSRACTQDFLKSQSTDYPGHTWEESFALRKEANPTQYSQYRDATDYYCIQTGPSYPAKILQTFTDVCKEIGGSVTQSAGQTGGTYSIKPNFKTEANYSFDEFKAILSNLTTISSDMSVCYKQPNPNSCIEDNLARQTSFKWSYNCGSEEEKAFANLLETFLLCMNSGSEGKCVYQIPDTNAFSFKMTADKLAKTISVSSNFLNMTIQQDNVLLIDTLTDSKPTLTVCDELDFEIENKKATINAKNCAGKGDLSYSYDGQINMYNTLSKAGRNLVSFVKPDVFSSLKSTALNLVNREVRVCAESRYSFINRTGNAEHYLYKLAFYVGSALPPEPVTGLEAEDDVPNVEKNITISFDADTKSDVLRYDVYYSIKTFNMINKTNPEIVYLGNVTQTSLERYSKTFKVPEDEVTYYFAVVAVDANGNYNPDVIPVTGVSHDSLHPGPLSGKLVLDRVIAELKPTYNIIIRPPEFNTDGSRVDDLSSYSVYIRKTDFDSCSLSDIKPTIDNQLFVTLPFQIQDSTNLISGFSITNLDSKVTAGSKYCVVVLAQDENIAASDVSPGRYTVNNTAFIKI